MPNKIKNKKSEELSALPKLHNILKPPVTIVAGTCEKIPPKVSTKYRNYLINYFIKYTGSIISGGTKAGIPGVLGSAIAEIRKSGNDKIRLIGYVPSQDFDVCEEYKIVTTGMKDFSVLEPLTMWRDIILSGIEPSQVRILGIGGGKIAAFEYRIALELGGELKLLKGSGGAADDLIKSDYSGKHINLQFINEEQQISL